MTYKYIIDTGTVVADAATLLTEVQTEYQVALGANIDLDPSTPQGTLITAEVLARTSVMRNNAELANMTNPNLAYGVFLDAVASLLGVDRGTNKSTIGTGIEITGDNLTVIPAGSRLTTPDNDIFETLTEVTIPISGVTTVSIASQSSGAIPLPLGSLNIVDGTIGWGAAAVVGTSVVTLGSSALTDSQFKNYREQTLFNQGIGSSGAIAANLLKVPNVKSVMVVENNTGATGIVHEITFNQPSAVWACVSGTPTKADVAAALYQAHSAGCAWDYGAVGNGLPVDSPNGTEVTDPSTGLKYRVKFTTPILYDCYIHITVSQSTSVYSAENAVRNAIMTYASGDLQGEAGFVIGASVSSFEVAGSVSRQLPGLYIKGCLVACVPAGNPAPTYPADYSMEFLIKKFEQATLQINNITVVEV